jgi:hypothetical protein
MPISNLVTVTAPTLVGIWIHDPDDPEATLVNFPFTDPGSRTEHLGVTGTPIRLKGRTLPVYDFSAFEDQTVAVAIDVPHGPEYAEQMAWLAALVRSRESWLYRDNRSRKIYGPVVDAQLTDVQYGSRVQLSVSATEFDETADVGLLLAAAL